MLIKKEFLIDSVHCLSRIVSLLPSPHQPEIYLPHWPAQLPKIPAQEATQRVSASHRVVLWENLLRRNTQRTYLFAFAFDFVLLLLSHLEGQIPGEGADSLQPWGWSWRSRPEEGVRLPGLCRVLVWNVGSCWPSPVWGNYRFIQWRRPTCASVTQH